MDERVTLSGAKGDAILTGYRYPDQITALKCQFTAEYTRPAAIGTARTLLQGVQFTHANLLKEVVVGDGGKDGGEDPTV